MIPTLLQIGPLPIYSFGLMIALAFGVGLMTLARSFRRSGLDPHLAEPYVLWGGVGGLLGARVWNILENFSEARHDLLTAFVASAGFTFYGGFIVAVGLLIWRARRDQVPILTLAGAVAPTLALGYAIGRLGCQLSGDGDYGMVTDSWLGMSFATGVVPTPEGVLVHPTPFYESVISLLVWFVLDRAERKPHLFPPVRRLGIYLLLMPLERFVVEFVRIEPRLWLGLSEAQWISVMLFCCGVLTTWISLRKERQPPETYVT